MNALPTDAHIDWNSKGNFSLVHYGSTFGKGTAEMYSSYETFCRKICQPSTSTSASANPALLDKDTSHDAQPAATAAAPKKKTCPTDTQRLQIALLMTPENSFSVFKYDPTHLIFGRICMIRQTRAFDLSESTVITTSTVTEMELDQVDKSNPNHVVAHEIAFGQNLNEDELPPALWFNLPATFIVECTLRDQLKYNRKKKNKRHANAAHAAGANKDAPRSSQEREAFLFGSGDEYFHFHHLSCCKALILYYPNDEAVHGLIRSVLRLELDKMMAVLEHPVIAAIDDDDDDANTTIINRELLLRQRFQALSQHCLQSFWPVNQGREYVSASTPLPPATASYCVPCTTENEFHGKLWNSFVRNLGMKTSLTPVSLEEEEGMLAMPCIFRQIDSSSSEEWFNGNGDNGNGTGTVTGGFLSKLRPAPKKQDATNGLRIFEDIAAKGETYKWVDGEW